MGNTPVLGPVFNIAILAMRGWCICLVTRVFVARHWCSKHRVLVSEGVITQAKGCGIPIIVVTCGTEVIIRVKNCCICFLSVATFCLAPFSRGLTAVVNCRAKMHRLGWACGVGRGRLSDFVSTHRLRKRAIIIGASVKALLATPSTAGVSN